MPDLRLARTVSPVPLQLCALAFDCFAMVRHWRPFSTPGPLRGREFEQMFCRYCDRLDIPLSERPGSSTLSGARSGSGAEHESDAVVAWSDLAVHLELKHITQEVGKNDVCIFNQKGLDFLAAGGEEVRRRPLYRILMSGGTVSPSARRLALQWGISVVEPKRLPFLELFRRVESLTGRSATGSLREEVPHLIVSAQTRVRRLAAILDNGQDLVARPRCEDALHAQHRISVALLGRTAPDDPAWIRKRAGQLRLCGGTPDRQTA